MYLLSLFTVLGGHLVSIGEYLLYWTSQAASVSANFLGAVL